ncbi:MAG: hypothetical protein K9M45_10775 [Kiritimatiellales bacterium]|nr:hypothetical protein [Kiritimatiellales bacterium]
MNFKNGLYLLIAGLMVFPMVGKAEVREFQPLAGPWEIVFDKQNEGRAGEWQRPQIFQTLEKRVITVPSCWEEMEQDYEGVAWYRCEFNVSADWKERHIRLCFDAVNYRTEAWINGEVVGMHEGGFGPFEFDINGQLRHGESNTLVVRVVGPAIVSDQVDDLVRNATPHWRGGYIGGIWQSVKLVATDSLHVADVFVKPNLEKGLAEAYIQLENSSMKSGKVLLNVSVVSDKPVASKQMEIMVPPGRRKETVSLEIPDVVTWSPDHPHLYKLRVQLKQNGKTIDETATCFGMRSFTVKDGDFLLNGKRIYIKGAFWEGQYPNTLAYPRDLDMVRKEIRMAKEAGFNMLRPWRMPPVPGILDLCDEIGMLLSGAPAVENMGYWPEETPQMEKRWTDDMVAMVKRDRNHPSIVLWETANEIIRKSNLLPRHRITVAARAADPTRLIIDESGGSRAPWGSHAYLPYSSEPSPMIDRHIYRRSPVDAKTYHHLLTYGEEGQANIISEVGYGGAPDFADNVRRYRENGNPKTPDYRFHVRMLDSLNGIMDKHALHDIFPDASALCLATQKLQADGNKLQLEALRINPKTDGYCLHAYTAGDWVVGAGVLDIWRQPKLLYQACKEVQQPLYLAIHAEPQNVYAWKGTKLTITAVNDGDSKNDELEVAVVNPAGQRKVLCTESRTVSTGISKLFEHQLDTRLQGGEFTVTATLKKGGKVISSNSYPIFVLKKGDLTPAVKQVALFEQRKELKKLLMGRQIQCQQFGPDTDLSLPVIVPQSYARMEAQGKVFRRLMQWVERGGTAIWLRVPVNTEYIGQPIYRQPEKNYMMQLRDQKPRKLAESKMVEQGLFPIDLRARGASGSWIPVGHYVREHPIFEGLPAGGLMGQVYQNVAPMTTIINLPGKAIAGSLSWDVIRDYRGPSEWWHGTDLAVVSHGKGRMILSMLKLTENLGKDPVADKILFNMLDWAADKGAL